MKSAAIVAVLLCSLLTAVICLTRFSNLKCHSFEPEFASFETCNLKLIERSVVGLNLTCKLHQIPVTNVSVSISVYKKSNGYNPFFYNVTADFCRFLRNRQKYPLMKILADYLLRNSNVNHSCPFAHDIIFKNLVLDQKLFTIMPLQSGDYMFRVLVGAYNSWKAEIKAYLVIN